MKPGPRNLITDVEGFLARNTKDSELKSGTTVLTAERTFTAAVHVMGGAPGTREPDLLAPDRLVPNGCSRKHRTAHEPAAAVGGPR